MRAAIFLAGMLFALAAHAAAPASPTVPPSHHAAKKAPAKAPVRRHHLGRAPVVAARHGIARKPVHPAAPVVTSKPVAGKPAPKSPAKLVRPPHPDNIGTVTGLPLPRYVSLRSDVVNMRSGPGERYPVLWLYKRKGLPVKIIREFDVWRLVEDMDGIKGWMHAATIEGRRSFVVTGTDPAVLRAAASDTSDPVAKLKPGVVGHILGCDAGAAWCRVQAGDYRGFLPRTAFWGTAPGEPVTP